MVWIICYLRLYRLIKGWNTTCNKYYKEKLVTWMLGKQTETPLRLEIMIFGRSTSWKLTSLYSLLTFLQRCCGVLWCIILYIMRNSKDNLRKLVHDYKLCDVLNLFSDVSLYCEISLILWNIMSSVRQNFSKLESYEFKTKMTCQES